MEVKIKVDDRQVRTLGKDYARAVDVAVRRLAERGEQILRDEVPKVTKNLMQGVSSEVDERGNQAKLLIAARAGRREPQTALLHLPGGRTREIPLRARPRYDYAEAVARGTGIYGPGGQVIRPTRGKGLLIPVDTVGIDETYIVAGGQKFVIRRFVRGRKPNPYDVRTAQRLEREAPAICEATITEMINEAGPR